MYLKKNKKTKSFFKSFFVGSFELAVLRMSRYYDLNQGAVLFGDTLLPVEAFLTPDTVEAKLVSAVFDFAKNLAELKLSEMQLALYSAYVLLSSGNNEYIDVKEIFLFKC